MLTFLTEVAGDASTTVVEESLSAAEKINDFFAKPGVQATCCIVVAALVVALSYEFIVKRLIRKLKK